MHGTLDYLLAAALIAVPLAVDFDDDTATVVMLVLGGAATLLAIGTNWSTGIVRVLPPVLHGVAGAARSCTVDARLLISEGSPAEVPYRSELMRLAAGDGLAVHQTFTRDPPPRGGGSPGASTLTC